MDAEVLAAASPGFEAEHADADEAGVLTGTRGDVHVGIGLAPIQRGAGEKRGTGQRLVAGEKRGGGDRRGGGRKPGAGEKCRAVRGRGDAGGVVAR